MSHSRSYHVNRALLGHRHVKSLMIPTLALAKMTSYIYKGCTINGTGKGRHPCALTADEMIDFTKGCIPMYKCRHTIDTIKEMSNNTTEHTVTKPCSHHKSSQLERANNFKTTYHLVWKYWKMFKIIIKGDTEASFNRRWQSGTQGFIWLCFEHSRRNLSYIIGHKTAFHQSFAKHFSG